MGDKVLKFIKMYVDNSFATFPTHKKRPVEPSWKDTPIDIFPTGERYSQGEFGVVLRQDILVIDLDPRNMGDRKVWSELKRDLNLPQYIEQSFIVKSGSGGIHIYLEKPKDVKIRKHLSKYPGIDFLTYGSYVIGAGSKHISGRSYEIMAGKLSQLKPCPASLLSVIEKKGNEAMLFGEVGFRDVEENINRFIEYIENRAKYAVEGENGDITTFKVACRGRDFNLSPEMCYKVMSEHYNPKCVPMWSEEELMTKVRNAYKYNEAVAGKNDPVVVLPTVDIEETRDDLEWVKELNYARDGQTIKPTLKNAVLLLENDKEVKDVLAFNEFSNMIEVVGRVPWENRRMSKFRDLTDREMEQFMLYFAKKYNVEFNTDRMWKALYLTASGRRYHPIKDEIESIEWDGVKRLNTWLIDYCSAVDVERVRAIGRKVLIGAIARIYNPGCKFDHVLILEGEQGIGKSTVCSVIGGKFYGDAPIDIRSKETISYLHNHWIIEFAEMSSTRKADINLLKNFITRTEDNYRPPYERTRQKFPRQCIFIGTINPDDIGYLTDNTGNRRFWCVYCKRIDIKGLREVRGQLLAEALEEYKKGEKLYLPKELQEDMEQEAKERIVKDPWEEVIMNWSADNPQITETTTASIYTNVIFGSLSNMTTYQQSRIARILSACGWVKSRKGTKNIYKRMVEIEAGVEE